MTTLFYRKNVNLRTNRWGRGAGHALWRLRQIPHIGGCGVCPLAVGDDPQIHRFGNTRPLQYRQLCQQETVGHVFRLNNVALRLVELVRNEIIRQHHLILREIGAAKAANPPFSANPCFSTSNFVKSIRYPLEESRSYPSRFKMTTSSFLALMAPITFILEA